MEKQCQWLRLKLVFVGLLLTYEHSITKQTTCVNGYFKRVFLVLFFRIIITKYVLHDSLPNLMNDKHRKDSCV